MYGIGKLKNKDCVSDLKSKNKLNNKLNKYLILLNIFGCFMVKYFEDT